jgi:hypothetical protein
VSDVDKPEPTVRYVLGLAKRSFSAAVAHGDVEFEPELLECIDGAIAEYATLTTERDQLRAAVRKLCAEIDWFTSGGGDPYDRCSECGNPGYGMLRDARNDALALLEAKEGGR